MARNHVTVDALGFFGEPLDEGSGVNDFALGFGQWLALLQGHQASQVVLVLDDQLVPATQLGRTFFGGQCTPGRQRFVSSFDRTAGFGSAHFRHGAQNFARCRVVDLDRLTIVRINPRAIDEGLLAEQLGVFKLHDVSFSEWGLASVGLNQSATSFKLMVQNEIVLGIIHRAIDNVHTRLTDAALQ
ncbi:hypothetical protein D3C75_565380 [compost metagenome]